MLCRSGHAFAAQDSILARQRAEVEALLGDLQATTLAYDRVVSGIAHRRHKHASCWSDGLIKNPRLSGVRSFDEAAKVFGVGPYRRWSILLTGDPAPRTRTWAKNGTWQAPRAQSVLSLVFKRRDDAEQACVEVAKAVAKAVEITRPALTAAGEP